MYRFNDALDATLRLLATDSVQGTPCEDSPFGEGVAKCLREVLRIAADHGFKTCYGDGYYAWAQVGEGELFEQSRA